MRRLFSSLVIIFAAGALAIAGTGMPARASLHLAGLAVLGALATALLGALLLHLLRHRSIGGQVTVVSLTAVASVAVGAGAAARAMFISLHDFRALVVILVAAVGVGIAAALTLGARVAGARASLVRATQRIGAGEAVTGIVTPPTKEMAALAGELNEMSARLDIARKRERALEASRRELVAWVSHDLRSPLAGIRAMGEALEDGVVTNAAEVDRYHRSIREEADRLAGLVDDLFELSRIHSGALTLEMTRTSLTDIVSDAVASATPVARAKGVTLRGGMADELELELSNPEIARVLRNLLENAIRHTPADGAVSVQAGAGEGHVYVSVQDGCGGIPENDLGRVFDVAFRGQAARTPGKGGGGLGLAIARGIVEAHRGELEVRNSDGGCNFTVRLPFTQPESLTS